ncbi:helix-turn-helix transcriptional regulator [Streptomyces sp. NPDC050095]|uniref:helix-turn-helix domain-containing protein n=1 Tax=unclassified Streptomyces TaxID=2593676 RepID=UPI00341381C8
MDAERAELIGRRVRAARQQRGLSLRALAQLSGLSAAFLSMVENGQRLLDRSSHITALAEALRLSPTELTGAALPSTQATVDTAHRMIPVLRHTLMGYTTSGPAHRHTAPPPAADVLARRVAEANRLYHAAEYSTLATALPGLLSDLHAARATAASAPVRERLTRLLADAYHPATTLLLKNLGYTDLAFIAVTRATETAAELDDPVRTALSHFFRSHVLLAAGTPGPAVTEADRAMRLVQAAPSHPASLALLGELHLITATGIAQDAHLPGTTRAAQVRAHLAEAEALAARTGETRAWHLNFGPTNVAIHYVTLHTDLGLHTDAVARSTTVHPHDLPVPGRQAAFHADLGRSLAQLRHREGDAVTALLTAERIAPQRVRTNPLVRDTVGYLLNKPLPAHTARDLRGLAHRTGLAA